jgi:hypothetical protein
MTQRLLSFAIFKKIHFPRFLRSGLAEKSQLTFVQLDFSVNLKTLSTTPSSFSAVTIFLQARV